MARAAAVLDAPVEAPDLPEPGPEEPEVPEPGPTDPPPEDPVPPDPEATYDDEERIGRLTDPRRAVVSIIEKRLERMLQPVDEDEVWHGVNVITRRDLAEALMAPLPPASAFTAGVRTPAFVYVDAVCPVCGIAGEISLEVEAKLVATAHGRKLQLAAKAAPLPHQCGQQRLRDVEPTRPVKGQTAFALGADEGTETVTEETITETVTETTTEEVIETSDDEPEGLPF